jgi:hypothetical protein
MKLDHEMMCNKNHMDLQNYNVIKTKGRDKSQGRTREEHDPCLQLYKKGIDKFKAQERERSKRPVTPPPPSAGLTKEANQRHIRKLMERRFDDIFFILDGSDSGFLTASNLKLEALHPNIIRVMADMFYEIEDFDLCLNKQQFIAACVNLHDVRVVHSSLSSFTAGRSYCLIPSNLTRP